MNSQLSRVGEQALLKWATIANIILVGSATACLMAWVYFAYFYLWTRERRFTSLLGLILGLVLPGLLGCFLLACLRLRATYKVNLAILCVSLAGSLYGEEILLSSRLASEFGLNTKPTSALETVANLRHTGVDAVPLIAPNYLLKEDSGGSLHSAIRLGGAEVLPLGGIARHITFHCNQDGKSWTYESDEHGFNNPPGVWESQSIDIAAVGNSFTQGYCVAPDTHFMGAIRAHYPGTLNLAMDASGPLLELAALKEFLPAYEPKVVLWVYFEGYDLSVLQKEQRSPLLMSYLQDGFSQGLRTNQNAIDVALQEYVQGQESFHAAHSPGIRDRILADVRLSSLRKELGLIPAVEVLPEPRALEVELLGRILAQASAAVRSRGGQLYFVYLPDWRRYGAPEHANKYREQVLGLAAALHIPIIDIHTRFQSHADPISLFPYRRPGHYTEEGYGLIGEEILHAISRR